MKQDLKKELHQIIDAIDDEQTLSILKEDLDGLTHEQLKELDRAIEEADNDTELVDWQSFKSELAK